MMVCWSGGCDSTLLLHDLATSEVLRKRFFDRLLRENEGAWKKFRILTKLFEQQRRWLLPGDPVRPDKTYIWRMAYVYSPDYPDAFMIINFSKSTYDSLISQGFEESNFNKRIWQARVTMMPSDSPRFPRTEIMKCPSTPITRREKQLAKEAELEKPFAPCLTFYNNKATPSDAPLTDIEIAKLMGTTPEIARLTDDSPPRPYPFAANTALQPTQEPELGNRKLTL